ncbi:hypothetical protein NL676_019177 [Syzygium grande]|nr:hypothetical protein NL676_019177 [Syzygium grande]
MLVLLRDGLLGNQFALRQRSLPARTGIADLLGYLGSRFPQGVGDRGEVHAGLQADRLPNRRSGVDGQRTLVGRRGRGGHRDRARRHTGGSAVRRPPSAVAENRTTRAHGLKGGSLERRRFESV